MDLKSLAKQPQLIKITLDDEATVTEFGESLDFYIYDRQPVDLFIRLGELRTDNFSEIVAIVNDMILDESGNRIIVDNYVLPQKLYVRVVEKVIKQLGK